MTEREKMLAGQLFNPSDKCFFWRMLRAELLQRQLNRAPIWRQRRRDRLINKLFGSIAGKPYCMYTPIHVVYGENIHVGRNFFSNYNCTMQDYARITIGDDVWLGPNVTITTVVHPLLADARNVCTTPNSIFADKRGNYEYAKPVVIGNSVVIYSGVIVCAGVNIGDNTVIGAGSVVTRSIPAGVLAFGNPCRVRRAITESDGMDARETMQSLDGQ